MPLVFFLFLWHGISRSLLFSLYLSLPLSMSRSLSLSSSLSLSAFLCATVPVSAPVSVSISGSASVCPSCISGCRLRYVWIAKTYCIQHPGANLGSAPATKPSAWARSQFQPQRQVQCPNSILRSKLRLKHKLAIQYISTISNKAS